MGHAFESLLPRVAEGLTLSSRRNHLDAGLAGLAGFTKKGTDYSLESFRTLLDGTTNWPAVMEALDKAGYHGYVTFEYFHPFPHYPEALIYQSSDALDRIVGRKR